jgi:hypothetical protein
MNWAWFLVTTRRDVRQPIDRIGRPLHNGLRMVAGYGGSSWERHEEP